LLRSTGEKIIQALLQNDKFMLIEVGAVLTRRKGYRLILIFTHGQNVNRIIVIQILYIWTLQTINRIKKGLLSFGQRSLQQSVRLGRETSFMPLSFDLAVDERNGTC
jgi:hypothetical protein